MITQPRWRNWHTQQVEGLCSNGRGGSSPLLGISAADNYPRRFVLGEVAGYKLQVAGEG